MRRIARQTTAVDRRRIRTATRALAALSTAGRRATAPRRDARASPPSGPRQPPVVVGARRRTTDCCPCRQSPPTDVANVAEPRRLSKIKLHLNARRYDNNIILTVFSLEVCCHVNSTKVILLHAHCEIQTNKVCTPYYVNSTKCIGTIRRDTDFQVNNM